MKKFLNTLYITTQGAYLNKEGESVLVNVDNVVKLRVPVHTLGGIVCFGNVMCSPFLMHHCAKNNVLISCLSEQGKFLARVVGPASGNILLRTEQYRRSENETSSMKVARVIVLAKIANSRVVLQRFLRDHGDDENAGPVESAVLHLEQLLKKAERSEKLEDLRGLEGDAGKTYFSVFDKLIVAQRESFSFVGRNRRPPLDNMNALLSFIYTLLVHDCTSALEAVGLDPQAGFLHRLRSGRPSLALDMMEEFRAFFADRLALSLVNLRQVDAKGFKKTESGAVEMNDDTRKTLLLAYQKRKQEESRHPFIGETAPLGLFFHIQALLLSRFLRGDIEGYPPIFWK